MSHAWTPAGAVNVLPALYQRCRCPRQTRKAIGSEDYRLVESVHILSSLGIDSKVRLKLFTLGVTRFFLIAYFKNKECSRYRVCVHIELHHLDEGIEVHGYGCCNVERLKWCNLRAEWSESVSVYTEYGSADTFCHRLSYILTRGLCSYPQSSFPLCLSTLELGYQGGGEEASEAEPCLAYPCSCVWSLTDSESLPVAGSIDQTITLEVPWLLNTFIIKYLSVRDNFYL